MLTRRSFVAGSAAAALAANKLPTPNGPQFIVALLTMVDARGKLDDALNRDYLQYLASGGADGGLVMGTTGEFASFSIKERKQALESTLKHKGRMSIMSQIGASNLPETLELLDHATGAGADSVLVLPPYYFKNPNTEGVAAFFEPVLKAAKLPVLLYNIPQLSGVPISHALLNRLKGFERLYGTKDSFSKNEEMLGYLKAFPNLKIITGLPGNIATNLRNHGAGTITGNGSVFLKETTALFEAYRKGGDVDQAQANLVKAGALLQGYDGVPAMKFALTLRGLKESGVRPPFIPLGSEKRKELAQRLGSAS